MLSIGIDVLHGELEVLLCQIVLGELRIIAEFECRLAQRSIFHSATVFFPRLDKKVVGNRQHRADSTQTSVLVQRKPYVEIIYFGESDLDILSTTLKSGDREQCVQLIGHRLAPVLQIVIRPCENTSVEFLNKIRAVYANGQNGRSLIFYLAALKVQPVHTGLVVYGLLNIDLAGIATVNLSPFLPSVYPVQQFLIAHLGSDWEIRTPSWYLRIYRVPSLVSFVVSIDVPA